MKHLKYIFTTFVVALLATSCSQEELPGEGGDTPVTGQTQTYTFTVSPDIVMEGDAKTRSEGTEEEKPTRCFMQVFDSDFNKVNEKYENKITDGSFTFEVQLATGKEYHIAFYADNSNAPMQNDLTNIQYDPSSGEVVAYGELVKGKPENMNPTVTLKHIVTKITLKHIGNPFTLAANEDFKITFPCATEYNMLDDTPLLGGYKEFTYTFAKEKNIGNGEEVCSFYTIVPDQVENWPDITLNLHQLTQTISGIEWKVNSHVTLQGDLSEDNPKWGATSEYVKDKIDFFFKDENGDPEGTENGGVYQFYLPSGKIADLEAVISAIFHKNVELDLTNFGTIFEEVLDNDYTFTIKYNPSGNPYLNISATDSKTYRLFYTSWNIGDYEDFSVVSDKLKN